MKITQIIAWVTFLLGLLFRFNHFPGSHFIMIVGILLLSSHCVIFFINNTKENIATSFLHLSYTLWTIYLFLRIFFLNCGPIFFGFSLFFIIAFYVSITFFILHFTKSRQLKTPQILFVVYFIFSVWLSQIHSDKIFYFLNLNTITQTTNRNENFWDWDKYSWFLYIVDKQKEAIQANLKAQQIIEEKIKKTNDKELLRELKYIKKHNQYILDKSWIDYQ